jgi:hypothetical protein
MLPVTEQEEGSFGAEKQCVDEWHCHMKGRDIRKISTIWFFFLRKKRMIL